MVMTFLWQQIISTASFMSGSVTQSRNVPLKSHYQEFNLKVYICCIMACIKTTIPPIKLLIVAFSYLWNDYLQELTACLVIISRPDHAVYSPINSCSAELTEDL